MQINTPDIEPITDSEHKLVLTHNLKNPLPGFIESTFSGNKPYYTPGSARRIQTGELYVGWALLCPPIENREYTIHHNTNRKFAFEVTPTSLDFWFPEPRPGADKLFKRFLDNLVTRNEIENLSVKTRQ